MRRLGDGGRDGRLGESLQSKEDVDAGAKPRHDG
jgi:hypothetical protein